MNDILLYEKIPSIENNFTVKFRKYYGGSRLVPHWHEHIELLYFISGNCVFTCDGKTFDVTSDDFVVVNSTEIHSYVTVEDIDYFCILIYPQFFADIKFDSRALLKNLIHNDKYIKECIGEMYEEYRNRTCGSDMMLKSYAYRLMAYLVRNYTVSCLSSKELDLHNAKLGRINLLLKYISKHYNESITTAQLASLCYLSESHFCRFFKKMVGKSATEYINEYRVEKAAVMLAKTDESITAIASDVGFDDINYFSRTFKKIKKESPGEYRRKQLHIK